MLKRRESPSPCNLGVFLETCEMARSPQKRKTGHGATAATATAAAATTATAATAATVATAAPVATAARAALSVSSPPPSGPAGPGPPSSAMTVQRTMALLTGVYAAAEHAVDGIAETPRLLKHLADIRHAIRLKLLRCGCSYADLARAEKEYGACTPPSRAMDTLRKPEEYVAEEYAAAAAAAGGGVGGGVRASASEDREMMSRLVDEAIGSPYAAALLLPPLVVPNVMYEMLRSNTFAFNPDSKCTAGEHPMLHQMRAAVDTAFLMALSAELRTTPPRHDLLVVAFSGVCTSIRALERSVNAAPHIAQLPVASEVTRALSSWPATCELVTAVYEYTMALWRGSANTRTADGERSRLKARLHYKSTLEAMDLAAGESREARADAIVHAVVFLRNTSDRATVGVVNGVICSKVDALERHEGDVCNLLRNRWEWKAGAACSTRTWQWLHGSVLSGHIQRRPKKKRAAVAAAPSAVATVLPPPAVLSPPSPPPDRVLHNRVATAVLALVCTGARDLQYDQCMLPETLALDVARVREMRERFNLYTRVCCIVSLTVSWMSSNPAWRSLALDTRERAVANVARALAQCLVESNIPHRETARLAWAAVQKLKAATASFLHIEEAAGKMLVRALVVTLGDTAQVMLVQYGECFREALVYAANAPVRGMADAATRHQLDTLFRDDFMDALASTMQPLALSLVADIREMVSNNFKIHKDLYATICTEALSREHVVLSTPPPCSAA